jgi:hypothetical protein
VARLRSALAAPGSTRLAGVLVALAGVALLIFGVVALRDDGSGSSGSSGAAPAPTPPAVTSGAPTSAPTATPSSSSSSSSSSEPTPSVTGTGVGSAPPPRTTVVPPPPVPTRTSAARAPITVLNNSVIMGLADRAATQVQARGWAVAQVGNFAGRLVATTVYYTPGDAGQEAAARELAREFGQIDQVLPRYAGLPPTPAGIVLVVTKDW